jgi:Tol biopolymer transport system component
VRRPLGIVVQLAPLLAVGCGLIVGKVDDPRLAPESGTNSTDGTGGSTDRDAAGADVSTGGGGAGGGVWEGGAGSDALGRADRDDGDAGAHSDDRSIASDAIDASVDLDAPEADGGRFESDAPEPKGSLTRVSIPVEDASLGRSDFPSISTDGQLLVFQSYGAGLVADGSNTMAIFLRNLGTGATTPLDFTPQTHLPLDGFSQHPAIARDGMFMSFATLATYYTNNAGAAIVAQPLPPGEPFRMRFCSLTCAYPVVSDLSPTGYNVAYVTPDPQSSDDKNMMNDVYVVWGGRGQTERISVGRDGADSNDVSDAPSISADGDRVAFESRAGNLVAGDLNAVRDVFVRFRSLATTVRVSVSSLTPDGGGGLEGDGPSYQASISADGKRVAFTSEASNLVPGDRNTAADVFVHDLETGETLRVSVATNGAEANGASSFPSIDRTGRVVAFLSYATNLDPAGAPDGSKRQDLYVRDLATGRTTHVSPAIGDARTLNGLESRPAISGNGRVIAFPSDLYLVPGAPQQQVDIFAYEFSTAPWL